jgi:dihydropteroate synthase
MQNAPMTGDAVPQVLQFLELRAQALQALGVEKHRIVLDPGIGFGKTVAQNFSLLARQRELLAAGWPLLAAGRASHHRRRPAGRRAGPAGRPLSA